MKPDARCVAQSPMPSRGQYRSRRALLLSSLIAFAVSLPVHSATFPGPYVSFGTYSGVQDGSGIAAANFASGPVLSGSYNFSQVFSDPSADKTTITAGVNDQNSIWGVMNVFSQVTSTATLWSGNRSAAFSSGELEAGDTITPTSGTLANGTLVNFLFTYTLHYSATASPTTFFPVNRGGGGVFIGNEWPCGFGTSGTNLTGLCGGPQLWSVNNGGTSSGTLVIQRTIGLAIGQTTPFVEDIWFQNNNFGSAPGTGTVDASNTAWLNITSLNPNASFTTGSGSNYSGSPEAPEPDTLALLAAGLIGLAGAKRRLLASPPRGGGDHLSAG